MKILLCLFNSFLKFFDISGIQVFIHFLICVLIVKVFINHSRIMVFTKNYNCFFLICFFDYSVANFLTLSILLVKMPFLLGFSFVTSTLFMKLICVSSSLFLFLSGKKFDLTFIRDSFFWSIG